MHELAVGTRFIDHALYSMCMLAMCCLAMRLGQSYGYYAGVVSHVTSSAAAAFESNPNEGDVHLMSLHFDELLACRCTLPWQMRMQQLLRG